MPAYAGVDITSANTDTTVFTNSTSGDLTLNVNFCNRNGTTATVRLHVVTSGGSAGVANAIEWDRQIAGNGVMERWAVTLGQGQFLVARSTLANVNVVCWGA